MINLKVPIRDYIYYIEPNKEESKYFKPTYISIYRGYYNYEIIYLEFKYYNNIR